MDLDRKELIAISASVILLTGIVLTLAGEEQNTASDTKDWRQIQLTDVSSGEKFEISELETPVLVESFAVWCPTCTRQQQEIKKLHNQNPEVTSVSIDTDPNEGPEKIRTHVQKNGFDWRYAVAPIEMTKSLSNEFGNSVLNPPTSPVILFCENGSRKLPSGVKPVSTLEQEIEKGC